MTTRAIHLAELPDALTQAQAVAYMGVSQGAVSEFMRKNPDAVIHDHAGRRRLRKTWAAAYTTGTVDALRDVLSRLRQPTFAKP